MSITNVRHFWSLDPAIAQTVEGDAEYGNTNVVSVHDAAMLDVQQQILTELKKIEYHLMILSEANLETF